MIPKEPVFRKLESLFVPAVIVLVGVSAFGLGRLSATGLPAQTAPAAPAPAAVTAAEGKYVASKSGSAYYLPTCSGVSRIKEENKVWFITTADAKAAGYGPASNCPGL